MDPIKASVFEDRLLKRKNVIHTTLARLRKERDEVVENNDWLDLASHESRSVLVERLADWYLQEAAQIDNALSRLYGPEYGTCRACHQPIEPGRLETFPETQFCWGCQETREKFESG